ncbi:hypothetical protein ACROYT_G000353 [Oculina patagonica]
MAAAPDPHKVLCSTNGKANFQRLARLLISGGTTLLREVFDQICPPSNLPTILKSPATEKQLKSAKLTKPQWDCLYPSPGVYGKSEDCDVTLLFKLLRTICNLIPPTTGWDALPASTDHSLAADLARIKYYRNSVYGHVKQEMEIIDDEFPCLWKKIREALVAIAGQISPAKKTEWQEAIDNFLKDPLTAEDKRNVQELLKWYENDTDVKQSLEKLKTSTQEGLERLETSLKGVQSGMVEKVQFLETAVREEVQDTKDQLKEELKSTTQEVQCLEKAVREEAQDIKDQLGGELKNTAQKLQTLKEAVREESQDTKDQLKGELKSTKQEVQCLEKAVREEAQDTKEQLKGELKIAAQNVQCLVRDEAQDIKGTVAELQQSIDGLHSTVSGMQAEGGWVMVKLRAKFYLMNRDNKKSKLKWFIFKCGSIGPDPQAGWSELVGMPIHSSQQEASTLTDSDRQNAAIKNSLSAQEVLTLIAHKYLVNVNPSTAEEFNGYLQYLRDVRNVLVVDTQPGSLIVTLACRSLEILEGLWEDYCSGHLNEMAQKFLVTEEVLKELGLAKVTLRTTISEEEYKNCREYFLQSTVRNAGPAASPPMEETSSDLQQAYAAASSQIQERMTDFEKAFDSLEWDYLFKVLNVMNFGPSFINWVRTFYSNISSCVINNGHSSEFFSLQREVRQGCPLSGLLFVLALEPLAHQIRITDSIKGLENGKKITKLSLYADDTTAFIREDSSAVSLFALLDQFSNLSGLKINKSKTEGLWLGRWKSRLGKDEPSGISWPKEYVNALGICFPYYANVGIKLNLDEKLAKFKMFLTSGAKDI